MILPYHTIMYSSAESIPTKKANIPVHTPTCTSTVNHPKLHQPDTKARASYVIVTTRTRCVFYKEATLGVDEQCEYMYPVGVLVPCGTRTCSQYYVVCTHKPWALPSLDSLFVLSSFWCLCDVAARGNRAQNLLDLRYNTCTFSNKYQHMCTEYAVGTSPKI